MSRSDLTTWCETHAALARRERRLVRAGPGQPVGSCRAPRSRRRGQQPPEPAAQLRVGRAPRVSVLRDRCRSLGLRVDGESSRRTATAERSKKSFDTTRSSSTMITANSVKKTRSAARAAALSDEGRLSSSHDVLRRSLSWMRWMRAPRLPRAPRHRIQLLQIAPPLFALRPGPEDVKEGRGARGHQRRERVAERLRPFAGDDDDRE